MYCGRPGAADWDRQGGGGWVFVDRGGWGPLALGGCITLLSYGDQFRGNDQTSVLADIIRSLQTHPPGFWVTPEPLKNALSTFLFELHLSDGV